MKKIFAKQNILPVVVLGAICLVVAALLGGVNMITSPIIEEANNQKANAALLVVLPGGKNFEEIDLTEEYPDEVNRAYKADIGYVFEVNTRGKEQMTVMCGVDSDGKIVKIEVLSEQETPGYKEKVFPNVTGDDGKYNGKDSSTVEPELFTGATLTSNGVYNAVKASFNAYAIATGGEVIEEPEYIPPQSQREDEELIGLAGELVADAVGFTEVEFDAEANSVKYLAKVFKENSGKGYVAYVLSISEYYGNVDTENLIHIGNDGKVKNIKKITWEVSPANPEWGYNPPSDEKLGEFYKSLNGKDSSTIGEVDIHTGATNTTTTLVASITEALNIVGSLIKADMPTPEDEVKSFAGELIGAEPDFTDVTPDNNTYLKRLYKDNGGNGYVAYVSSISSHYGTVDTENLIHIGNDGNVKNIKKLTWEVSPANPDWGYNPPSDEKLAEFYNGLVGKNSTSIDEVDLKTGATNTTTTLVASIKEALTAAGELIKKDMPTSEDEVKTLAGELIGAEPDFTDVTPAGMEFVKRIYKDNGGKGYVAYVSSISSHYGTVDTENLIYIGNDGAIKAIKKMTWAVSDAVPEWGYNPPSEEELGEFYNGLVGKNAASIDEVDLKTGATNTTTVLVETVKEALSAVTALINDAGAHEAILNEKMENLVPGAEGFEKVELPADAPDTVKALYKVLGYDGYVVYATTSTLYVANETESLVYVSNGKVKNIELITWTVGHGVGPGDFASTLVGKNAAQLADVELVAEATGTSGHLRDAVIDAVSVVPYDNTPVVVGVAVLSLAVIAFAAYIVIPKIIRRRKNG